MSGADGAADTDFFGALRDADEHHIHDDDAAHNGGDGTDHDENAEEGSADALPQGEIALGGADKKVIFLIGGVMTAGTESDGGFVLSGLIGTGIVSGFHFDGEAVAGAAKLQERTQGDDEELILILPEDGADFFESADYEEFFIGGADGAPMGLASGKNSCTRLSPMRQTLALWESSTSVK